MYKFKIGDRVSIKEDMKLIKGNLVGTIKKRTNDKGKRYEIDIDCEKNSTNTFRYYILPESCLENLDSELLKEKIRLKEEIRLGHLKIDPFGEENW